MPDCHDRVCLRRAHDPVGREDAQPLDVPTPNREGSMARGHSSRRCKGGQGGSPHGMRDRAVRDPAGNTVRIQQVA